MAIDVYLSEEKIQDRIKQLASEIDQHYNGEEVTVVGVLNGAFMFTADLIRQMKTPVLLEFLAASSYGDDTVSFG